VRLWGETLTARSSHSAQRRPHHTTSPTTARTTTTARPRPRPDHDHGPTTATRSRTRSSPTTARLAHTRTVAVALLRGRWRSISMARGRSRSLISTGRVLLRVVVAAGVTPCICEGHALRGRAPLRGRGREEPPPDRSWLRRGGMCCVGARQHPFWRCRAAAQPEANRRNAGEDESLNTLQQLSSEAANRMSCQRRAGWHETTTARPRPRPDHGHPLAHPLVPDPGRTTHLAPTVTTTAAAAHRPIERSPLPLRLLEG